jgi:hypothetical protein
MRGLKFRVALQATLPDFVGLPYFCANERRSEGGQVYHNGLMIAAIITNKNISLLNIICVNHVHPFLPGRQTLRRKQIMSKERKCSKYPWGWWHQFVTGKEGLVILRYVSVRQLKLRINLKLNHN